MNAKQKRNGTVKAPEPMAAEPAEPVRTEAGLIDPETGEIIEPSLIFRKFGWSELPVLSVFPTKAELADFEAKLDQVAEVILSHTDKVERWTAANERRCTPYVKAAEFYTKSLLEPMARQLAPHALPKFKSGAKAGEYKRKRLDLPAGSVSFTTCGGAYVHDADLLKQHIAQVGCDQFAAIEAKPTISYSYPKLIAALNAGKFEALPGTGIEPKEPLGAVKVKSPIKKEAADETDNNDTTGEI